MATIRIAETVHPTRSGDNAVSSGIGGGVYSMRNVSGASLERRSTRGRGSSLDRRSLRSGNNVAAEDEDSGLRRAGDFKKRQVHINWSLQLLAYSAFSHPTRSLRGKSCCGSHINLLVSYMAISGQALFTSIPRPSDLTPLMPIS
jgi:hypothetical protein